MTFKHFFFSLLIIIILNSCEDPVHIEYGLDGTIHNNNNNNNTTAQFQATIDGALFEPANKSATIINGITNITGIDTNGELITISIMADQVGVYSLDYDGSSTIIAGLAYKENTDATDSYVSGNIVDNSTGSIEITSIDTTNNLVSGTFYTTARNGSGDSVNITNGEFTNIPFETEFSNNNENEFFAKVDGVEFEEDVVTGTKVTLGGNTNISIVATKNNLQTMSITIPFETSTPGTYDFSAIPTQGTFIAQYNLSNTEIYSSASGSLTINSHNTNTQTISGTFYFMAQPLTSSNPSFEITEGTFTVTY